MSAFQPEAFGKYYLVDKVAVGGMAEIFKAKSFSHGGFEKLLVIKRILGHLSDNLEFIEMFIDEAKISVTLQHPNIVQIYDFGKIRDNYFIAMECVEGKDVKGILRKLAERRKLLPIEFAVYISHEMCKGLDYAHKKTESSGKPMGIVHRDISPSNILVSYTGEVKVADFGIARAEDSLHETRAGVLKGKFEYMSPEQAQGKEVGPRSDVFATGIILHEMLTGRRLFKTKSEIQTLEKIKSVDIDAPSALNPNIPARLDEIVMRALARDIDDRYQDCRSMQTDLLDFMYPATPDLTKESLEHFLQELFSEEISDERRRLDESTKIANELWESASEVDLDADWNEADRTVEGTLQTPTSKAPYLVMGAVILVLLAAVVFFALRKPEVIVQNSPPPEECVPDRGCVTLVVKEETGQPFPEGTVPRAFMDGIPIGTGFKIFHNDIQPEKDVEFTVEADGYESFKVPWYFPAGQEQVIPIYLKPKPESDKGPDNNRRPDDSPGVVLFETEPSGARVFINDEYQGKAPIRWNDGFKGVKYEIRYELRGYQPEAFEIVYPGYGKELSAKRELSRASNAPKPKGKVTVNCTPGWGEVLVNDRLVAKETPTTLELEEGEYKVATVNPLSKVKDEKVVKVSAGVHQRILLSCK